MRTPVCITLTVSVALGASAIGCTDPVTVYDGPDAAAWGPACTTRSAPDGGVGYVTNSLMNSVSVLDLGAGATAGTHVIGVTPLVVNGPHHLVLDDAHGWMFSPMSFPSATTSAGPHAAHGSSQTPGVLVRRSLCDFRLLGELAVDPNPGDIAITPDRRTVFVSHFDLRRALLNVGDADAQRSNLVVVDAASMTRRATVPLCVAAHGMAVAPDGRTLYVACYGDDALAVVDLTTPTPTPRLVYLSHAPASVTDPSYGPYAVGISPDGSTVWVGCSVTGLLVAFDTATAAFDTARARTFASKPLFPAFGPDGATMVVPLQGPDAVARVTTAAPLRVAQQVTFDPAVCTLPHQVARGPDGRFYVVCEGRHGTDPGTATAGTVVALDPDTLRVVHTFPVGLYPDDILFGGPP